MQGSARKDVVFGAARVYTFTVPGPKWKSWLIRVRHGGDTAQAHMLVDGEDFRLRPDPCNNALSQTVHTASSRRPSRARARARRFRFTNVTLDSVITLADGLST